MPLLTAAIVDAVLKKGGSTRVNKKIPAKFRPGDVVTARNINPRGHTRLPRYVRGKTGVIDRDHGVFIFPDSHCESWDQKPQHVYSVRFPARTLWGGEANGNDAIYVDLWDDYLDAARR